MQVCPSHWQMMREAISSRGLDGLIAKDGEIAMENTVADLEGEPDPKHERFDPLMSLHWHFMNRALEQGGLYLMAMKEDGSHYCPICEFETHSQGFDAKEAIGDIADQMLAWCRDEGLVPKPS